MISSLVDRMNKSWITQKTTDDSAGEKYNARAIVQICSSFGSYLNCVVGHQYTYIYFQLFAVSP